MCKGNAGLWFSQRPCCSLRGWGCINKLAPLYPCCDYVHAMVAVVSTLVRDRGGGLRVWSLTSELPPLSPSACMWWQWWPQIWLPAGPKPKGFDLQFWVGLTFYQYVSAHDCNGSLSLKPRAILEHIRLAQGHGEGWELC